MLAAMGWIADQLLTFRIHDPIEQFQGDLTDQYWEVIVDLTGINRTFPSLNSQAVAPVSTSASVISRRRT
jgi:hypothetical protein